MSKIFISCALPYANGPCHLGHIRSTYLPADIYARYNRMVGNDVLMASHIFITDLDHGSYAGNQHTSPEVRPDERELHYDDVKIGNNVWIGENVVILKGVTIGDGCIVGANSLITKNIDANCIVVQNNKIIKKYNQENSKWESVGKMVKK